MIDAESQYQGLYVQAQSYISALRAQIGARFPVALAGFPYIDYHPSFPYSVFLGPNGAQYNVPQMYWRDIGTSVTAVYSHTYAFNQLYQRPIFPLGQVFDSPPASQINQFRAIARYYGAKGVSWWDWQSAGASEFKAVWSPIGSIVGFVPQRTVASLDRGAKGDVVVWAQEHLVKAGQRGHRRRRLRQADPDRGLAVPVGSRAACQRRHRPGHLERAAALSAAGDQVDSDEAPAIGRRRTRRRRNAPRPALGLAVGQAQRAWRDAGSG